jgi:hypothetical protein
MTTMDPRAVQFPVVRARSVYRLSCMNASVRTAVDALRRSGGTGSRDGVGAGSPALSIQDRSPRGALGSPLSCRGSGGALVRRPPRGATMVAISLHSRSSAAVPGRPHFRLTCANGWRRTSANPYQPPRQCVGQGLESPQRHPDDQAVSPRGHGLSRLWLQLWLQFAHPHLRAAPCPCVGCLAGQRRHDVAVHVHRRAHPVRRPCPLGLRDLVHPGQRPGGGLARRHGLSMKPPSGGPLADVVEAARRPVCPKRPAHLLRQSGERRRGSH